VTDCGDPAGRPTYNRVCETISVHTSTAGSARKSSFRTRRCLGGFETGGLTAYRPPPLAGRHLGRLDCHRLLTFERIIHANVFSAGIAAQSLRYVKSVEVQVRRNALNRLTNGDEDTAMTVLMNYASISTLNAT
jgi:hypothetical protein